MLSDVEEYFSQFTYDPAPADGTKPIEVVWKTLGTFELTGSRLCFGDSWSMPYDAVFVDANPGRYTLSVECFSYGTDGRVARLRVLLDGAAPDSRVGIGRFSVDVASAGVSDGDLMERYSNSHPGEHEEWMTAFTSEQCGDIAGFFPHEAAGTVMAFVSTGFGDGTYEVRQLLQGTVAVGADAVFLAPNQGYFEELRS